MAAKKTKKKVAAPRKAPAKTTKTSAGRVAKKSAKVGKVRVQEVVHWEIQAQNPQALHRFYAKAFGWKIDADNPMQYGMVASAGREGINGGIGGSPAPGSRVLVYAAVSKITPVLARIEALGGKTIMPRTDVGPVIMALYMDPEGNTMGLLEA